MTEMQAEAQAGTLIPSQGERLAALEGSYAHVATRADVAEVRAEIVTRHSEAMSEIADRHREVMSEIARRHDEPRARDEELLREMNSRHARVISETTNLGNRLTGIKSDQRSLRWVIATMIALGAIAAAIANFLLMRLFHM